MFAATIIFSFIFLYACGGNNGQSETPGTPPDISSTPSEQPDEPTTAASGEMVIKFDYERLSGAASNQFAVWIENMDGQLVKTLYATQWTARGGYASRPDSIALWVEKSGLASASVSQSEVDAIAGATPRTGNLSYIWDLTDTDGNTVSPGEYKFNVEGTLRWRNHVIYSGVIDVSGDAVTVSADAEFHYEASDRQTALTENSPENSMIGAVTASFIPANGD
jgi:hypothetical protein